MLRRDEGSSKDHPALENPILTGDNPSALSIPFLPFSPLTSNFIHVINKTYGIGHRIGPGRLSGMGHPKLPNQNCADYEISNELGF